MSTREPKFWAVTIVTSLLSATGGTAGLNYLWFPSEQSVDPVLEYRMNECEERGDSLLHEIEVLKTKVGLLPPPDWRMKINTMEEDVKALREAMIRLERHGHPEVQYEK